MFLWAGCLFFYVFSTNIGFPPLKIALVQTNPIIGDFTQNVQVIRHWTDKARQAGCDLAVFPELSICGYPPQDLLERSNFLAAHDRALTEIREHCRDIICVVGGLEKHAQPGKPLYNTAFVLEKGQIAQRVHKQLLPAYDVFDERRYFQAGKQSITFACKGLYCALTICEDIWWQQKLYPHNPLDDLALGAVVPDLLINISASPYHLGKLEERQRLFSELSSKYGVPLLYANQVGGQDSLVFDGHSMLINAKGQLHAMAEGFIEDMIVVDSNTWSQTQVPFSTENTAHLEQALVCGLRDYMHKSGFTKALLGISGGIDSAVTASIACKALGPDNVLTIALPSPYTSQASIDDAKALASNLGCSFKVIPIEPAMQAYTTSLQPFFAGMPEDVTEQNLQARIRGNILMALSNKFKSILLSTGNKSELAVGYCTLYGDMCGGIGVLADVSKMRVYELAKWMNREKEIIPQNTIERPPTAELKPDQLDQDDLPPYDVLDAILQAYVENDLGVEEVAASLQVDVQLVQDVARRIHGNEYKRLQAPLGIRVTKKAFGIGRRYPIVQRFQE